MLKALFRGLFSPKSYIRVGFSVLNSTLPAYQFGVAGSRVFVNKSDQEIREILENKYGGKLDRFIVTARWTE